MADLVRAVGYIGATNIPPHSNSDIVDSWSDEVRKSNVDQELRGNQFAGQPTTSLPPFEQHQMTHMSI